MIAAIAGVALTSCVKDEVTAPQSQGAKITFDKPVLYQNENTKANVYGEIGTITEGGVNYTYPKAENFVIYAVKHEGDLTSWTDATAALFNGFTISYDDDVNGWAPKTTEGGYYYWEAGKKLSFAATSPADLEQANWGGEDKRSYGKNGLTITDFEVAAEAEKHFDLLFSKRAVNMTSAEMQHGAGSYSGLPIVFQHALSSIRFSVANSSVETVVLTGIEIDGVKYKGTFNENINEQGSLYERGEGGNVAPEWTVADDKIAAPYVAFEGSVAFRAEARYVTELVAQAFTEGQVDNVCNQLLVMPQDLTDDAVVTVHYTVNGAANSKTVKLKGLQSTNVNVTPNQVTGTINKWEMGKRYTYRLYYSSETAAKDKIYFAPSTEGWQDVDVIIVPL